MDINVKTLKLGVIGCGKMASAIIGGVIKNNFLNPSSIFVYDINDEAASLMLSNYNVNKIASIDELLSKTDVILLATKPFVVDKVMNDIKQNYKNQLIMTILAGVKIEKYLSFISNAQIVRIMPNTPALVNEGMSALCASVDISIDNFNFAFEFMKNCGKVVKTTEDKIDIITALSGSGPAYYFKIIDLMARAAEKMGLNYEDAILLSTQTALGSAKMIFQNNFNIEQLIKNVTTPGGCTEVGNEILNNSNINEIIDKTIFDTAKKAAELG